MYLSLLPSHPTRPIWMVVWIEPHFSPDRASTQARKGVLIKMVVGCTSPSWFQAEVQAPQRLVLELLCAPDLPDCKRASGHLSKLAGQFRGVGDLCMVLAEMNIAINDPSPMGTRVGSLAFSPPRSLRRFLPQPQDEADLVFFLKWKQNIKPVAGSMDKRKRTGGGGCGGRSCERCSFTGCSCHGILHCVYCVMLSINFLSPPSSQAAMLAGFTHQCHTTLHAPHLSRTVTCGT